MTTARRVTVRGTTPPDIEDLGISDQADYDAREAAAPAVEATAQTQRANGSTLRQRAQQALAANATFLALPAAQQAAQAATQMVRVTRQNSALIRLVLGALDSTADS
jgi:hypothetical protein